MRDMRSEDGRLRRTLLVYPLSPARIPYWLLQNGHYHAARYMQGQSMVNDRCLPPSYVRSLQSCSRVLLSEEDRRVFLTRFRQPHLENTRRTQLAKQVNQLCRKVLVCPYCGEFNGTVKKVGALKIVHEKFRGKKMTEHRKAFEASFHLIMQDIRDLHHHVTKAQEDLNPLKVLQLFKQISAQDCELLGLDPAVGRPEDFVWQYISVPPVCIRPSVAQEAAT